MNSDCFFSSIFVRIKWKQVFLIFMFCLMISNHSSTITIVYKPKTLEKYSVDCDSLEVDTRFVEFLLKSTWKPLWSFLRVSLAWFDPIQFLGCLVLRAFWIQLNSMIIQIGCSFIRGLMMDLHWFIASVKQRLENVLLIHWFHYTTLNLPRICSKYE